MTALFNYKGVYSSAPGKASGSAKQFFFKLPFTIVLPYLILSMLSVIPKYRYRYRRNHLIHVFDKVMFLNTVKKKHVNCTHLSETEDFFFLFSLDGLAAHCFGLTSLPGYTADSLG